MTALTQAQFARHIGVDRAHVTRLKQSGRLVIDANGRVDVESSTARIAATADPAKAPSAKRNAVALAAVDSEKAPKIEIPEDDEPIASPDYQKARARREEANANLAELELARQSGDLMETAVVRAIVADAGATCRAALETMPAILAPQLATISDDHAIRQLLEEQIGAVLNELCDRLAGAGHKAA